MSEIPKNAAEQTSITGIAPPVIESHVNPESAMLTEALREGGATDAGSLAHEHSVEAPPEQLTPRRFRKGRRMVATVLSTIEAAQLSPGNLKDNIKFGFNLITTDPYKQAEAANRNLREAAPKPEVRQV